MGYRPTAQGVLSVLRHFGLVKSIVIIGIAVIVVVAGSVVAVNGSRGPGGSSTAPGGVTHRSTAYVVNTGDDTVTPISLPAGPPGTPISVGSSTIVGNTIDGPVAIAITPDGKTAYVVNELDKWERQPGSPVHGYPDQPARWHSRPPDQRRERAARDRDHPDGKTAYVVNGGDDTVTPISLPASTPGPPISVGKNPDTIAISPDGRTAYVANSDYKTVTPISLPAGTPGPRSESGLRRSRSPREARTGSRSRGAARTFGPGRPAPVS